MGMRGAVVKVLAVVLVAIVATMGVSPGHHDSALAAPPAPTDFGFEAQVISFNPATMEDRPGTYTSLTLSISGLTAVVTRPGSRFDITAIQAFEGSHPSFWGTRSLDPTFAHTSPTPFVV